MPCTFCVYHMMGRWSRLTYHDRDESRAIGFSSASLACAANRMMRPVAGSELVHSTSKNMYPSTVIGGGRTYKLSKAGRCPTTVVAVLPWLLPLPLPFPRPAWHVRRE